MCGLKYRNYHIYTLKTCMLCIASYNAHISMRDLHYPSPLIRLPTCLLYGQTFSASLCFGVCNDNFQITTDSRETIVTHTRAHILDKYWMVASLIYNLRDEAESNITFLNLKTVYVKQATI